MSSSQNHKEKYLQFKKVAEREDLFIPVRIEAYFSAMFHLIETKAAQHKVHIDVHKNLRRVLESNPDIFDKDTKTIWTNFVKLERDIRPGQIYGGAINGEKLKEAKKITSIIENICLKKLKEKSKTNEQELDFSL
jgi:hypothetical protein